MYEDKDCVFIITINRIFKNSFKNKDKSIKEYFKLDYLYNGVNKEIRHFKIEKCVFEEYKKTLNYKLLDNNSIIG